MKRYLVTTNNLDPFLTDYFTPENCFAYGIGMVVFDLYKQTYMSDGETWIELEEDHL
jgi:hypothetical protein